MSFYKDRLRPGHFSARSVDLCADVTFASDEWSDNTLVLRSGKVKGRRI